MRLWVIKTKEAQYVAMSCHSMLQCLSLCWQGVLLLHGHCFHQYRLKMPDSLRTSAKGLAIEDLRERTSDVF